MKKKQYVLLIVICLIIIVSAQEKLYVFYPSIVRPQIIQDKIQASFPGINVTVFGRYSDFIAKIEIEPPDMVITKTSLIEQFGNYSAVANGVRGGKTEDKYVLLSINEPIDLTKVTSETIIGTIDIFGRNGMNRFVLQFFSTMPKLKRVTKIEDLLPLLTFNMAAAIMIQEPAMQYFKRTSKLNFCATELPQTKAGIVALGVKNGSSAGKVISTLKNVDKEFCSFFEVESWK